MKPSVEDILLAGKKLDEEGQHLRAESRQILAEAKQKGQHLVWLIAEIKRQHQQNDYAPLQEAIRSLHRCRSRHVASFAARKVFRGDTVWEGMVEEFKLIGHRQAKSCYAWRYSAWGRNHVFSILKLPPVDSPQGAVQLALAARGEYQLGERMGSEVAMLRGDLHKG